MNTDEVYEKWLEEFRETHPGIVINQFGTKIPPYAFAAGYKDGLNTIQQFIEKSRDEGRNPTLDNVQEFIYTELESAGE